MAAASDLIDQVSAHLSAFVERMRDETEAYGADAAALVSAAERTLRGGKRLRARFCHAGWASVASLHGNTVEPGSLWDACAALEIFQSAALVHDDLIDNSDTRRGRPAAHRAFETAHAQQGLERRPGSVRPVVRSAARRSPGGLERRSAGVRASPASRHADAVRAEYARMRRDVTIGQFLDIAEESAWSVNDDADHAERALRVVSLKAARYSVEQPLLIGAALAGADQAQRTALRAFGHPLGMAFQLRDDVLGVFGDERVTGKPAGDDLREGKRTLLIAWTREALAAPGRRLVDELLGDPQLTPDQIASLQATIAESGALARVERLIADYAADGEAALSGAPLDAEALELLRATRRGRDRSAPPEPAAGAQASARATRRTSLLCPSRSAAIGERPIDSSSSSSQSMTSSSEKPASFSTMIVPRSAGSGRSSCRNTAGTANGPFLREPTRCCSSKRRCTRPSGSPRISTSSGRVSHSSGAGAVSVPDTQP